jgi:hypothetical protein
MLGDLVDTKNNKHEFCHFFNKKTLFPGKTAITFAYNIGSKSFLYEKVSKQKVT